MPEAPRLLRLGDPVADLRAGLLRGEVAAVPTESSYALAVDPRSTAGVERIFAVKARERGKPLPVVAASLEQVMSLGVRRDDPGLRWGLRYWPAPLTVLLEVAMPLAAMAGDTRLGVRIPAHAGLRRLLGELGIALTATSANLSGEQPITSVDSLRHQLGGALSWIVDDGLLPGGEPSTVVAWSPATVPSGAQAEAGRMEVLRHGAFPWY
ncbi:MAG TPA: L-threonylcarbamoyladenylate synthase [Thermoanaerobaculia bacterium]|nr:L-threonylcarbamoyladenylate synthase [Thermoanaerobaculia bacterium]